MPLRRDEVIEAGIKLLDEVGLDDMTTRRLAERLGVRVGALYWHVASKQELLDNIADRIAREAMAEPLPTGDWEEQVRGLAYRLRAAMLSHRDGARLLAAGPSPLSIDSLAFIDRLIGALRSGGASLHAAAYGADTIVSYVTGFTLQEQHMQQADLPEEEHDGELGESLAQTLDPAMMPNLVDWAPHLSLDREPPFAAGIDVIINGLRAELATSSNTS